MLFDRDLILIFGFRGRHYCCVGDMEGERIKVVSYHLYEAQTLNGEKGCYCKAPDYHLDQGPVGRSATVKGD